MMYYTLCTQVCDFKGDTISENVFFTNQKYKPFANRW